MQVFLTKVAFCILLIATSTFDHFAQNVETGIVWKNISESYANFNDIKPTILNGTGTSIYYDEYFFPTSIVLERLVGVDRWADSSPWRCGTGYRPSLKKLRSSQEVVPNLYDEYWFTSTVDDYISKKFTQYPDYTGRGKYRLRFTFGYDRRKFDEYVSYSPVFEVIERK